MENLIDDFFELECLRNTLWQTADGYVWKRACLPHLERMSFRNYMVIECNHHALLSIIIGFLRETDFSFLEENKND